MRRRRKQTRSGVAALSWAMVDVIDVARGRTVRAPPSSHQVVGTLVEKGYVRWVSSQRKAYIATEQGVQAVRIMLAAPRSKGRT